MDEHSNVIRTNLGDIHRLHLLQEVLQQNQIDLDLRSILKRKSNVLFDDALDRKTSENQANSFHLVQTSNFRQNTSV